MPVTKSCTASLTRHAIDAQDYGVSVRAWRHFCYQDVEMIAECPSCAWPSPTAVSSHRSVQYLRCVCGQWLISVHGKVVGSAGGTTFSGGDRVAEILGFNG